MTCEHTQPCMSCNKCNKVVFQISSGNAINLVQIIEDYIKIKAKQGSLNEKLAKNVLEELIANSYRLQPTYQKYSKKTLSNIGKTENES